MLSYTFSLAGVIYNLENADNIMTFIFFHLKAFIEVLPAFSCKYKTVLF